MFSTFSALNSTDRPEQPAPPRPKRNQVARACDWCRLNRIKCDDRLPCQNCRSRGGHCSNTKQFETHSLKAANREIHRLRDRLKDFQEQLDKVTEESKRQLEAAKHQSQQPGSDTPNSISGIAPSAELPDLHRTTWDGFQNPESRTGQVIHFGPFSSPYMVMRLNGYMSESSNQRPLNSPIPVRISQAHQFWPTSSLEQSSDEAIQPSLRLSLAEAEDLSREQEENFLVLMWQAYHCIYPIIAEEDFREYYNSLWAGTNGQGPRQPSALVDSLLAVCMQYGSTFLGDEENMANDEKEPQAVHFHAAAHTFYRRSQRMLMDTLEHPSIPTLQSHIYCIIYQYNVANLDTALALLGLGIRIAHMLRLHLRPLGSPPRASQELHSRIWWTLYQLDSQISMSLGRPPLINPEDVGCAIPTDMRNAVQLSPPSVLVSPPEEELTWLSFHVQYIRLTAAARGVQEVFRMRCAEVLQVKDLQDIQEDPPTLELLARFMSSEVRPMYDWVQAVPQSLKNQRKGSGEALSTDRTPLSLNPASPLWLQRQRLLLEITYHHLQIATLRPFIRFPPRGPSLTPLTDGLGISALNHAVVLTNILKQVLSETDILSGWTPAFQYQWDATICIISFVLANPVCPPTPAARNVLPAAFQNLNTLGKPFAPSTNSIQLAWEQFRSSSALRGWSQLTPPNQSVSDTTGLLGSVPSSTGMDTTSMQITGTGVMASSSLPTDPFSGSLTSVKLPSNAITGNEFLDSAAITPPMHLMDTSFNLPIDMFMETGTPWMPSSAISLDSWNASGSQ
ncbi:uncharacterized protein N7446_006963 [Penicillium canescens]|uniref:Zn(2)-C6 fungal-type domain-containing protein n=1 Tax=Penicillium canescens TaxID=5083 RepID=A0AAD6IMH2_PENCN|nr:uncharacterized protein N7446_006963 [Penicillium canescens]KAJ6049709.1 hypothetical protein N7444_006425 [Penicillium canescens]KAJ6052321.1 hypothetical protein N7460_002855 [Penicillium canescens]KAJ6062843.1 hypothetical protein N7446_006963 [Penicillium canescens]